MPASTEKRAKKMGFLQRPKVLAGRESLTTNILFCILIPLITLFTLEWVARGDLLGSGYWNDGFFEAIDKHFASFFFSWLLLVFIYVFISQLTGLHAVATAVMALCNIPGVVTYFKLQMRGEPFLPWDILQLGDLVDISGEVEFSIPPATIITAILYIGLIILAAFVRVPRKTGGKRRLRPQLITAFSGLAGVLVLMFAIFLSPTGTQAINVREDMWMQDRYYRNYGVITGFLTNLQMLNIEAPEGYSQETVENITAETLRKAQDAEPYYENSPSAVLAAEDLAEQPDIIFVMAESFWDMRELAGVEYDRELMANFDALSAEGASGKAYTPSFGGGTCDVEFEALTGFSMEHLPAASKPFQQYINDDIFSLPNYLKESGYDTLGIHGYGRRFWNRDITYPHLGIDEYYAEDDFVDPDRRRGYISDDAMVDMIIEQYEARADDEASMFIHAVTMQNHTTYKRDKYPEDELVKVTLSPEGISDQVVGEMEDCATGIYEMDQALGKLTDYLRTVDRPTIVVFWGDHMNPMSDGYNMFEACGFIEKGDTASPNLRQVPLLMWSNYAQSEVDLGTIATYNISPVMMDLYGLEKPVLFEYLTQQLGTLRARTRGITVNTDGMTSYDLTSEQQRSIDQHGILQYDYMFGGKYLENGG